MTSKYFLALLLFSALAFKGYAQDKIYTTDGRILNGKVLEIGPTEIKFKAFDRPDGPLYIMRQSQVDSIVYANGFVDLMGAVLAAKWRLENVPQLNTWSFDLLGFTFLSVSQSYERRFKKQPWLGLRVPLYVGFIGGGIAGVGLFKPGSGVYYGTAYGGGFSIATGINPKFYFINRRKIRPFAGPEVTIGFSKGGAYNDYNYYYNNGYYDYTVRSFTFAAIAKFGLTFNPKDKFHITVDGGCGVGGLYGTTQSIGTTGLWHIGLAMGTNF
ncbi:MAG TPA: hypothetical protein VG603_15620 [Chitinophagales bacterium]|nr:hypothetical protein [Chitinophagales bacterium]